MIGLVFKSLIILIILFNINDSKRHKPKHLNNNLKPDINDTQIDTKYVIIDTDAGEDDALALLLAFEAHKKGLINILGILCSYGNTNVNQVIKNVELTQRASFGEPEKIKVFKGVEQPLLEKYLLENTDFGSDGLGNATQFLPDIEVHIQERHAVIALIGLVREYPKQITFLALGPLTNLAMAIQLNPDLTKDLVGIFAMGGLINMLGNVSPTIEFNFINDPESVDMVLKKSVCPMTIITWDVAMNHKIPWKEVEKFTNFHTEESDFIKKVYSSLIKDHATKDFILCDILIIISAAFPQLVLKSSEWPVLMELSSKYLRGQLTINRSHGMLKPFYGTKNVTIIESIDVKETLRLINQMARV